VSCGRQGLRYFYRGDAVLHRLLHLLDGAHLDLTHALARDAEFLSQLRERDLFFGEPAPFARSRSLSMESAAK